MNRRIVSRVGLLPGLLLFLAAGLQAADPVGTGFSYQGRLKMNGNLVAGATDLRFRLWNDPVSTDPNDQIGAMIEFSQVADPNNPNPVSLERGLFQVELDFGFGSFDGDERWLEIQIRHPSDPTDTAAYAPLTARQKVTATPYAIYSVGQSTLSAPDGDPAAALVVDAAGRVGIGTATPERKLHLYGGGAQRMAIESSDGLASIYLKGGTDQSAFLSFWSGDLTKWSLANIATENDLFRIASEDGSERIVITQGGNVGIGTTTPGVGLHVRTSSSGEAPSNVGGLFVENGGTSNSYYVFQTATAGAGRCFSITNGGRVGIGTMSPLTPMHVAGGTDVGPTSGGYLILGDTSGANLAFDENEIMARNNGAGDDLYLNNWGGSVIIGARTPTEVLTVDGNVCANAYNCASDVRLKQNVTPMTCALTSILQLRPVRFDWRRDALPDGKSTEERQIGFIAQEVLDVTPEIVSQGSDGYYALDYGRLTPVLAAAVQELHGIVQQQEQEIQRQGAELGSQSERFAQLEADNAALRDELAELRALVRGLTVGAAHSSGQLRPEGR